MPVIWRALAPPVEAEGWRAPVVRRPRSLRAAWLAGAGCGFALRGRAAGLGCAVGLRARATGSGLRARATRSGDAWATRSGYALGLRARATGSGYALGLRARARGSRSGCGLAGCGLALRAPAGGSCWRLGHAGGVRSPGVRADGRARSATATCQAVRGAPAGASSSRSKPCRRHPTRESHVFGRLTGGASRTH